MQRSLPNTGPSFPLSLQKMVGWPPTLKWHRPHVQYPLRMRVSRYARSVFTGATSPDDHNGVKFAKLALSSHRTMTVPCVNVRWKHVREEHPVRLNSVRSCSLPPSTICFVDKHGQPLTRNGALNQCGAARSTNIAPPSLYGPSHFATVQWDNTP